ncbi:rhodanese-like domain-containing protein [candidate division KSB1 bacterium]|nr:rhodanese-like domain-containing protein [bacterium]NUM67448.1 rhodanese-like domain-containing protein [candidate division KSB1 bacterium]
MKWHTLLDRRFGVALLIILGGLLALSPAGLRTATAVSPQQLAEAIINEQDHLTAEELAAWLIDKKPDLLVVDMRSAEEYAQYHIPGAVHIPFNRLFEAEALEMMAGDKTVVLYSNGGTHAAQAWVLLKQQGIDSRVLLGGLNYWTAAILNPTAPGEAVADAEILKYEFRKGAAGYFGGSGVAPAPHDSTAPAKPKVSLPPAQKKKARAGC